jgi:hypothetical protein
MIRVLTVRGVAGVDALVLAVIELSLVIQNII